jgi:hypothetical protein
MDGRPIVELRPFPGPGPVAATPLQRWHQLPPIDARQPRTDLDRLLDASLWSAAWVTSEQFEHATRAAGAVSGVTALLIIGSQAVHGSMSGRLPIEATRSVNVDVAVRGPLV